MKKMKMTTPLKNNYRQNNKMIQIYSTQYFMKSQNCISSDQLCKSKRILKSSFKSTW